MTHIPFNTQLTLQQAADVLGVSLSFLNRQLDEKVIPCHRLGKQRRVLYSDLMQYKHQIDQESRKVLDELVEQAQELRLGY